MNALSLENLEVYPKCWGLTLNPAPKLTLPWQDQRQEKALSYTEEGFPLHRHHKSFHVYYL